MPRYAVVGDLFDRPREFVYKGNDGLEVLYNCVSVDLYVTGDLAFYAMVLGKEGMSGNWCHLCRLSRAEFSNLAKDGDPWTWELYREVTERVQSSSDKKPQLGVKTAPWWDFIPLDHYVVPLLHCLIGIGNDILTAFRETVSESIDYISTEEIQARQLIEKVLDKIDVLKLERDTWDGSSSGGEMTRLKNKLRGLHKSLQRLTNTSPSNRVRDGNKDVDMMDDDEVFNHIDDDVSVVDSSDDSDSEDVDIDIGDVTLAQRIAQKKIQIKETAKSLKPLQKLRKTITDKYDRAVAMKKRLKAKIIEFKKERRQQGDGIEAGLFKILKNKYNVTVQAYRGGSLTGKDMRRVMENTAAIFD